MVLAILGSGCGEPAPDAALLPAVTPARLTVQLVDREHQPIEGGLVEVAPVQQRARTDRDGVAVFEALPPGDQDISATAHGFLNITRRVPLVEGDDSFVQIMLLPWIDPWYYLLWADNASVRCDVGPEFATAPGCVIVFPTDSRNPIGSGLVTASVELEWEGGEASLRAKLEIFEGGESTSIPFADGSLNLTVAGASPLRFDVDPALVSPAMTKPGRKIRIDVAAADGEPSGPIDLRLRATGRLRQWVDSRNEPTTLAATIVDERLGFGDASPTATKELLFPYQENASMVRVITTLEVSCGAGAYADPMLQLADPSGRSIEYAMTDEEGPYVRLCAPGQNQSVHAFSQVLWLRAGTWSVRTGGDCTCDVRIFVESERIVAS